MGWRERLALRLNPGLAYGVPFGDWLRLLWSNGFRVPPAYWSKAVLATLGSLGNSPLRWLEAIICGRRVAAQEIPPPLFILGHWRSGTTLLQNLLAIDSRFASPTWSEVFHPHDFLLTDGIRGRITRLFSRPAPRGLDNVVYHPQAPAEEEFALSRMTFLSPALSWTFPRRAAHYDRYLTFRGVPADEVWRWQAAFLHLARKLTWKYQRPLVFKSPHNTCRIKILLEIFPEARFVHIHRNPYEIYSSTRKMNLFASDWLGYQHFDPSRLHGRILRTYREMHEVYFEDRGLIPQGRLTEVAFAALAKDPLGQMRRIYEGLGLPDFAAVRPELEEYARSLSGYQKNCYPDLSPEVRADIAREWRQSFDEWHYPL